MAKRKKKLHEALLEEFPKAGDFDMPESPRGRGTPQWGIELEVEDSTGRSRSRDGSAPAGWQQVGDGSLNATGREYRSVPFGNLCEGFEALDRLHKHLELNWTASNRCGFHLHLDASAIDWREFALGIQQIEFLLYAMLPESRARGSYSFPAIRMVPINDATNLETMRVQRNNSAGSGERYYGLNCESRHRHNTIEIRYHSGTRIPQKIRAWVWLHWSLYRLCSKDLPAFQQLLDEVCAVVALSGDAVAGVKHGLTHLMNNLPNGEDYLEYFMGRVNAFRMRGSRLHIIYSYVGDYLQWRRDTALYARDTGVQRSRASVQHEVPKSLFPSDPRQAERTRVMREQRALAPVMAELYYSGITRTTAITENEDGTHNYVGDRGANGLYWCPDCFRYHERRSTGIAVLPTGQRRDAVLI